MLVITRRSGERICLGDDITITVLEISGSTVRLGIEAPAEMPVYRHEIWPPSRKRTGPRRRRASPACPITPTHD